MTDARPEQAWFAKADNHLEMARLALPRDVTHSQSHAARNTGYQVDKPQCLRPGL